MSSARVICPHCKAKLRISTTGGAPDRAKCRTCGRTFTPKFSDDVKSGAQYLDASVNATSIPGLSPLRGPAPAAPSRPAPATMAVLPPPPTATAVVAAPPAPVGWSAGEEHAAAVMTPAAPLAPPPEPIPDVPSLTAPALPAVARKRGDSRRQAQLDAQWDSRRMKPHEVALALAILIALFGGLGMLWYEKSGRSTGPAADSGAGATLPTEQPPDTPISVEARLETETKPLAPQLFGKWELRADDGRSGAITLFPDGSLLAASSISANTPDYHGHWYVLDQIGDQYLLEFGSMHRGPDSYRVRIQLTGPDAMTLLETVKSGTPIKEGHRFVRLEPPPKK